MNPTSYIIMGSLYQVQKYLTLANIQYSDQFLVGNGAMLAGLSESDRKALQDAADEATLLNRKAIAAAQEKELAFLAKSGMEVITPEDKDLEAFRAAAQPSYVEWLKNRRIDQAWIDKALNDAGLTLN